MTLKEDVEADVQAIVGTDIQVTSANQVPTTESFNLGNEGKLLEGTFMYVDMVNSTGLAAHHDHEISAKVIKSFLSVASRILRSCEGEIRSFDGDRVMAIFIGEEGLQPRDRRCLEDTLGSRPIVQEHIWLFVDSIFESGWKMRAGIGIDTGLALMVKGGIRAHNDLVSIGDPPNIAAKLSEIREGSPRTYITKAVWDALKYDLCYTSKDEPMWSDPKTRDSGGRQEEVCVSKYWRELS